MSDILERGRKLIACLPFADNEAGHSETAAWMREAVAEIEQLRDRIQDIENDVDEIVRDEVKSMQEVIASRDAELERLETRAASRLCASCEEQHPPGTDCPPHEVRSRGSQHLQTLNRIVEAINSLGYRCDEYGGSVDAVDCINDMGKTIERLTADSKRWQVIREYLDCGTFYPDDPRCDFHTEIYMVRDFVLDGAGPFDSLHAAIDAAMKGAPTE